MVSSLSQHSKIIIRKILQTKFLTLKISENLKFKIQVTNL